ncbi:MAG: hypothetical protein ACC662_01980 [Planctomycetota bacterium]
MADPALRIANRNPGSGTRALVEDLLAGTLGDLTVRAALRREGFDA